MKLQTIKIKFCNFYDKVTSILKLFQKLRFAYFSSTNVILVQLAAAVALWIISLITHPSSRYLFT